jgi:hypothetical protein
MQGIHRNPRRTSLHPTLSVLPALAALALAACGGVQVRPDPQLPVPLLEPMAARVAVVLDEELRTYRHEETRGGTSWKVELGPGHEQFFREVFGYSFASPQVFESGAAARSAGNVQGIFRPRIEQFSFATDDETGGQYWAVTIRYSIAITSAEGEPVDTLSLTGYGSARGGRAANAMTRATRSAMRDAAAKFLVQMPAQPLAKKLVSGQPLTPDDAEQAAADIVETVPIEVGP